MAQPPRQASRKAIVWTSVFILAGTVAVFWLMVERVQRYAQQASTPEASAVNAEPRPSALERKDGQGTTPLMNAVQMGELNSVRELLRRGVDANAADDQSRTPLMTAAEGGPSLQENLPIMLALLEGGAKVNARDAEGRTALYRAAAAGQVQAIDFLLRHGADPNLPAKNGDPPISGAVMQGQYTAARALLEHGADVNATNSQGRTPLMIAAQGWPGEKDPANLVRLLLAHGADMKSRDRDGKNALDWARSARLDDVLKIFDQLPKR